RQAVGLRGYAQRDPLHEYKSEAFQLFAHMLSRLRRDVTGQLMHVVLAPGAPEEFEEFGELPEMHAHHLDPLTGEDDFEGEAAPAPRSRQERPAAAKQAGGAARGTGPARGAPKDAARTGPQRGGAAAVNPGDPSSWGKVARNAPCPCGSGKKFKHCHGAIASAAAE